MIRNLTLISAFTALVACGDGAPFPTTGDVTDPDTPTTSNGIPSAISNRAVSFSYNPGAGTLFVTGQLRDGDLETNRYVRKATLDRGEYQAFTLQDDALDRHTTVYVRQVADVSAATAVTGGQFTYYNGGALYGRTGGFNPGPVNASDNGQVTYAGPYVGLSNLNGPDTDLIDITDPNIDQNGVDIPRQASPVTGRVLISVSFGQNKVEGAILDRQVLSDRFGQFNISDVILVESELTADGTFEGEVELPFRRVDVGSYGGTIGGNNGEAMAGAVFLEDHYDETLDNAGNPILDPDTGAQASISGEEEYGIFVVGRCGGPSQDATATAQCNIVDPL